MSLIRGVNSNTPKHLLLGAGAFYKNFVIGTDTPFNTSGKAKCIGATDGGGSFNATPEVRAVSVDGLPGKTKGLKTIDGWEASITANAKEITLGNMEIALATASEATITGAKKVTVSHDIEDTDYLDNITWAGTLSDNATPVYIVLKNAFDENGIGLTFKDRGEGVVALTLFANYDLDDLDTPPFEIIYPNA